MPDKIVYTTPDADPSELSVTELASRAADQVATLVRDELRLLRAEMLDKSKQAGLGTGLIGVAAAMAIFALAGLVATAALALSLVWPAWLACLVVALALLLLAGIVAIVGRGRVKAAFPLFPSRTARRVADDIDSVRTAIHERGNHDH